MRKINETMTVNEPLQKQVYKIIKVIKRSFDDFALDLIKQISLHKPGEVAFDRQIIKYEEFGLDDNVICFKEVDVQYNMFYCRDIKDIEMLMNYTLSCWFDLNKKIVVLRLPVAYYGGKIYLCVESSEGNLAHELLHCFQNNRGGFKETTSIYDFATSLLCNPDLFEGLKNENPCLKYIEFVDIKWLLMSIYSLDKHEIDANAQSLYREALKLYNNYKHSTSNEKILATYKHIKSNAGVYVKFLKLVNEIKSNLSTHKDDRNFSEFVNFIFRGELKNVNAYSKWISKRIEYAKKKFDKVIWYVVTENTFDGIMIENRKWFIYQDYDKSRVLYESGDSYNDFKKIMKERERFIKYF